MKIWFFNNYNALPEHAQLNRHYYFGKYLKRMGHEPVAFVGSHPHNTDLQLITGKERFREYEGCEFPWVLVKTCNYEGSKLKRVFSMFQYCANLMATVKAYERPDVILGSSAHPLAAVAAIRLARKYRCKGVVEIRDLWPESIVALGLMSAANPVVRLLYRLEKWLYTKADAIVFTFEGGRDYIVKQGWDKAHGGPVDLGKIYHVNNGVDLELFDHNRERYAAEDEDLDDPGMFKVVYAGSMRLANRPEGLVEVAKTLRDKGADGIRILIWGAGDKVESVKQMIADEGLPNIRYMGRVPKARIPAILAKGDLTVDMIADSPLYNYGLSTNKMFEYFASGKPVLLNKTVGYSLIDRYSCGRSLAEVTPERMADEIIAFSRMPKDEYDRYCQNARRAAEAYDYPVLTAKLLEALEVCA